MTSEIKPEDIAAILEEFQSSRFAELHIRFRGFELHLAADGEGRTIAYDPAPAPPAPEPSPQIPNASASKPPEGVVDLDLGSFEVVRAPYLGTFYRAPKPGEPAYVEVGSVVQPDSDLCLVEVMKLFTAVRAGVHGAVARILADDGATVEAGQPLFALTARS